MTDVTSQGDLTQVFDDLLGVPHVVSVVVVSADGLVKQKSTELAKDDADRLAAAVSGLYGLAASVGKSFASGSLEQVVVVYRGGTLCVASAAENTRLAVLCERAADMGSVAYQMSRVVIRIGEFLRTETRPTPVTPDPSTQQSRG